MAKTYGFTANNTGNPEAVVAQGQCFSITVEVDPTDANYNTAEIACRAPGMADTPARMAPGRQYTFTKMPINQAGRMDAQPYVAGEIAGYVETANVASASILQTES